MMRLQHLHENREPIEPGTTFRTPLDTYTVLKSYVASDTGAIVALMRMEPRVGPRHYRIGTFEDYDGIGGRVLPRLVMKVGGLRSGWLAELDYQMYFSSLTGHPVDPLFDDKIEVEIE